MILSTTLNASPQDIKALAWVDCGVLTVAAGNQIRCYLKWLTEEDSLDERNYR